CRPPGSSGCPSVWLRRMSVIAHQFFCLLPIGPAPMTRLCPYTTLFRSGQGLFSVWATDSSGNYTGNLINPVAGNNTALEAIETSFQKDQNNNPTIGPPLAPPPTVIESKGSTNLDQVASNYFLYAHATTN